MTLKNRTKDHHNTGFKLSSEGFVDLISFCCCLRMIYLRIDSSKRRELPSHRLHVCFYPKPHAEKYSIKLTQAEFLSFSHCVHGNVLPESETSWTLSGVEAERFVSCSRSSRRAAGVFSSTQSSSVFSCFLYKLLIGENRTGRADSELRRSAHKERQTWQRAVFDLFTLGLIIGQQQKDLVGRSESWNV